VLATSPGIADTNVPEQAPPEIDSGEAELAEAQLALGRPKPTVVGSGEQLDEPAEEAGLSSWGGSDDVGAPPGGDDGIGGLSPAAGVPPAAGGPQAQTRPESIFARLIHFLQGSWRELQRVQWPDRRQVFQATGVVIGFVIVAGVFLGVSDVVAQKIVSFILNGHG
jgi:preprotein translocase subunit SecE